MNLFQVLRDFNLPFLIIFFFIISTLFLISFILIIERIIYFRKIFINEKKIFKDLNSALNNKDTFFIFNLWHKVFSPLVNLIKAGLDKRNYSVFHIKSAIEQAIILELPKFEKNLTIIGVFTILLPIFGLIVLFVSNIEIFFLLESNNNYFLGFFLLRNIKIIFTFIYVLFCTFLITFLYYYIIKKKNCMIFIFEEWAKKLVISIIDKRE